MRFQTQNGPGANRFVPHLETLGERVVPAVTASFKNGILSVLGDAKSNTITISRDGAGQLLVNDGAVAIKGGAPAVANTALIKVLGQDGNDRITLNEAQGALPNAKLDGGAGRDTLTGGAGNDQLLGQSGNDVLLGKSGSDSLFGGKGNDTLTGGAADDEMFGQADTDLLLWNPTDGSDRIEGGGGFDALQVSGSALSETATLSAAGDRFRFALDLGNVLLDGQDLEMATFLSFGGSDAVIVNDLTGTDVGLVVIELSDLGVPGGNNDVVIVNGTANQDAITAASADGVVTVSGLAAQVLIGGTNAAGDRLEVNGLDNDDVIDATGLEPTTMQFRADGGKGNDQLLGGAGDDVLTGGDGADVILAGSGDNVVFGGVGNDLLRGEEGDDVLDGGVNTDTLIGNAGDDVLLNGEQVFDE